MKLVIIRPVITEKSLNRIRNSQYTFEVSLDANKYEIKKAVEKEYKVNVLSVKTMVRKGKLKTVGRKRQKKQYPAHKFAIVQIKKDQNIADFNQ